MKSRGYVHILMLLLFCVVSIVTLSQIRLTEAILKLDARQTRHEEETANLLGEIADQVAELKK